MNNRTMPFWTEESSEGYDDLVEKYRQMPPKRQIIESVPPSCRKILDLGCGPGTTGLELKRLRKCEVCGVEIFEGAAQIARQNLDEVRVLDLDDLTPGYFSDNSFDCIIAADILEHLRNPLRVLKNLLPSLQAGGFVVAFIPNVAHYSTIHQLLRQNWNYQDSGLMDRSHLRFFTHRTIKELFMNSGLEIVSFRGKVLASPPMDILRRALRSFSSDFFEHFFYYHYLVIGRRKALT
jgi:SAM-dependent methyltransferase